MKKIAVVGAGTMARVRARALIRGGQATVCGVASRHLDTAGRFAGEIGSGCYVDDFRRLAELRPDAILVEVPHHHQDAIVQWALESKFNVLIGGSLASSVRQAEQVCQLTARNDLVVETGYEARYSGCWESAKRLIERGVLGDPVAVRSIALWAGDPKTWYYNQEISGGMPLTHMTYCFINPIRWILGEPQRVSAFANRKHHTAPGLIDEETCVANVVFEHDVVGTLTAGFVKPGDYPSWSVTFMGTRAIMDVFPSEQGEGGSIVTYRNSQVEKMDFNAGKNAFDVQAEVFLAALDGRNECRNRPQDVIGDIRAAEAIVRSVRRSQVIEL